MMKVSLSKFLLVAGAMAGGVMGEIAPRPVPGVDDPVHCPTCYECPQDIYWCCVIAHAPDGALNDGFIALSDELGVCRAPGTIAENRPFTYCEQTHLNSYVDEDGNVIMGRRQLDGEAGYCSGGRRLSREFAEKVAHVYDSRELAVDGREWNHETHSKLMWAENEVRRALTQDAIPIEAGDGSYTPYCGCFDFDYFCRTGEFPAPPPPEPGCRGDPHIMTWNNQWYDYHGECDMVLLDAPEFYGGLGLTVHIRTKIRYDYSFVERVAVKIGDDVLEVGAYGDYTLNGVQHPHMPTVMGETFPVLYQENQDVKHQFQIDTSEVASIQIMSYKDMVNVKFVGSNFNNFASSVGLMGQFETGTRYGRDGKTVVDNDNAFGQEWQVLKTEPQLFSTPSPHDKCVLPSPGASEQRRRLGESPIEYEAAEAACAHIAHEATKEHCIYDVIATGDLELAQAGVY